MTAIEKTFPCLTCKQEIKLERKADNSGWNKFNLDGSEHKHEKKQPQPQQQKVEDGGALATEMKELREQIRLLVAEVSFLRMDMARELKELKRV